MLSRVETSVHIFAAYNVFKFEMTESGVNDTEYDENGNVTRPGDIQWGTDVQQTNGDFYQYTASDVHYVALTEDQMGLLSDELPKNKNLPTALQTVITNENLTVKNSWSTATTEGTYIIAFVYNKQLNEATGTVENIGGSINTVADKCYYVNEGTVTDLLTELFD